MRSRCRLKSSSSASLASTTNTEVLLQRTLCATAITLLVIVVCGSTSSNGSRTPSLPGPVASQPFSSSLLEGFIAPSSVAFPPSTSLSAYIDYQHAHLQPQLFQQNFQSPPAPPPFLKPPQALQASHASYSLQAIQSRLSAQGQWPAGLNGQEPTLPSPVYKPSTQSALKPIEPLEAAQSGTIVFTQERTLSRVAPTLPPSISDEPISSYRNTPVEGPDIIPESLVGPQGSSFYNGVQLNAKLLNCNETCYRPKKEGKSLKSLENKFFRNNTCQCDHDCAAFGDCCPDVLTAPMMPDWSCIPAAGLATYWVKQTCRKGWNRDPQIVRGCEQQRQDALILDPFSARPVSSLTTNTSYRNLMCAVCNDDATDYAHWRIRLDYAPDNNASEFEEIKEEDLHTLRYVPDRGIWLINGREVSFVLILPRNAIQHEPPPCRSVITHCLPRLRGTDLERRCRGYQSVVHDRRTQLNYRNIDCAQCNNVPSPLVSCGYALDTISYSLNPRNMGFGILLDFGGSGRVGRKPACPFEGQEYDWFSYKCRDVFCPQPNHIYRNKICVPANQTSIDVTSDSSVDDINTPLNNKNITSERTVYSDDFLKCPRTFLNKDEFAYLSNESIFVEKYNATYKKDNYLPTRSGAYICLHAVNVTSNELAKFSVYMGYISAIGLGVSIACLILHLAVFFLLPEMRNLSGKNLACLSMSLLIAYISFIAGQVDDSVSGTSSCRAIALVTYSAFLAAFFWMNSMAFDVWRTLRLATRELRVTTGPQWKRFIFYSIYSWGMTAFIVGLSVVLEHDSDVLPPEYRPAFGKYSCWFGHRKALLIFFVAPTGCIMLLNALFFLLTALMIISSSSASASIVKDPSSSARTNYRLYSRLAIMLGLVWSTGFLAGYFDSDVLWYIFIVLNTLQGLFIFIAFSCTKKVMWYCKERLPDFLKPSVYRSSASSHSSGSGGGLSSGSTQHSALSRRSSPRSSVNYRHTAPYLIYGGNNKLDMY
ncbi:hypothetical protein BIW11_10047 [Tropilaelaps mercedesae]|uniref:G-protein coupled receptors family 2 profile 2 domain-containing protein n=1 Tax=Tropilaelaps mercedesae TaxID=418985 RepID=A0A1V9XHF2_9ACAR|nr:hypothetical protein BIW11_10047 [Tropilaelaps mercedesae]